MSTKINQIIKETIVAMKERNLILTPDNYAETFCQIAKKNGVVVPDCQKLETYISRLSDEVKEQIKSKNVRTTDELFAFMAAKINSTSLNDPIKLSNSLSLMSKRVLQAVASLHNREAKKLADSSIEILNRKLDFATIDKVKDRWFEFLSSYDDSFFNRLSAYGVKSLDDVESAIVELDNALMRSGDSTSTCQKLAPLIVSMMAPSVSQKMQDDIAVIEATLKNDPKLIETLSVQDSIRKLIQKRIDLDRDEISSKVSVLDEVLENINRKIASLIENSSSSSIKMQTIKSDLSSINLKEDSLEGIREKLINITESIDVEVRHLGSQMSKDQETIKELQDKVSRLESELEVAKKEGKEDFLTKTATKRALTEELERMEERYKRYGNDYGVCFFDIDHFKKINDTYGHEAGDVILASVGQMLRKYSRQVDFVARYGGEEFVILLPQISLLDTINFANKMREIVQNSKFMYKNERINVTASCGVAMRSANTSSSVTIDEADKMLYVAKQNGRNQVMPKII